MNEMDGKMEKKAGVVNVFDAPYRSWSKRKTTPEEALELVEHEGLAWIEALEVNDKLIEEVATHVQAASRMLRIRADNSLEWHVDRALDNSTAYRQLREQMPEHVPEALDAYQSSYPEYDRIAVDEAINTYGIEIAEGQVLFHGGHWASAAHTLTTSRPFSTSFCPQVALRNAEWRGKAYDAGRVDLMVVRVAQPKTKAYAYGREGNHGNEKEIVFASGAQLKHVRETHIADVAVRKVISGIREHEKVVPAYVIEVEIS
ncbi:hypothetical protein [Massilia sp.]|uniref:hypothetical protein n=1 Tax=Massilia sp. TaxID=1882437 RepID=UPI003919F4F6